MRDKDSELEFICPTCIEEWVTAKIAEEAMGTYLKGEQVICMVKYKFIFTVY